MADIHRADPGPVAGQLTVEQLLLRAALLAQLGSDARGLAARLARIARSGGGRSCFEGGGSVQLLVDAPGRPELQVGIRLGDTPDEQALAAVLDARGHGIIQRLMPLLAPSGDSTLGSWLLWRPRRQAWFFDLRDTDPATALRRLDPLLDDRQRATLERSRPPDLLARVWAAKVDLEPGDAPRIAVYWLLNRTTSAEALAESLQPGAWPQITGALGLLLRRPGKSGRWGLTTELDRRDPPRLRLNNTAWSLVPEDANKRRAIGRLMTHYAGPRRYAEALWSLCHTTASDHWRVGRTCEVSVGSDYRACVRLYFSPQTRE